MELFPREIRGGTGPLPLPPLAPPETPKNPGLAFVVSLFVPGLGQAYCGKMARAGLTFGFCAACAAALVFLTPQLGSSDESSIPMMWGLALRTGLVLYVFGFLDAYFTAREINDGTDAYIGQNPRVGAVLNLLTRGFGYYYVGERQKGVLLFVLVGVASRVGMGVKDRTLGSVLELFVEVAIAVMAVDAYRIGKRDVEKSLSRLPPTSAPLLPSPGFGAGIPLSFAGVFALGYVGLATLGMLMPDYKQIDQSQAVITSTPNESVYTNKKYGVEMRIPAEWKFDQSKPAEFVETEGVAGLCNATFMVEAQAPFISMKTMSNSVVRQILTQNKNFRLVEQKPSTLGNLRAEDTVLAAKFDKISLIQHYLIARRGLSVYELVTTSPADPVFSCEKQLDEIRARIVIGK